MIATAPPADDCDSASKLLDTTTDRVLLKRKHPAQTSVRNRIKDPKPNNPERIPPKESPAPPLSNKLEWFLAESLPRTILEQLPKQAAPPTAALRYQQRLYLIVIKARVMDVLTIMQFLGHQQENTH